MPNRCAVGILLLLVCVSTGCVRRRMTVRSNPPGAMVYVDDQPIGVTPVSTPFTYYGTRKVQIFKDGYEPLTVLQRVPAPWYEVPPLDFASENLTPYEIRDERELHFDLAPRQEVPNERLIERAEALRSNSRQGHVTPLWTPPAQPQAPQVLSVP